MKTAICYYSKHHGNTKKLVDAIKEKYPEIDTIDIMENREIDLNQYDRIGLASGVYYGDLAKPLFSFMSVNLPEEKELFYIYTAGKGASDDFTVHARKAAREKDCRVIGIYGCSGFDTFGPLKLVGGIKKGHPDADEIQGVLDFYAGLKD